MVVISAICKTQCCLVGGRQLCGPTPPALAFSPVTVVPEPAPSGSSAKVSGSAIDVEYATGGRMRIRIKAHPRLRKMPIIAVTSHAMDGGEEKARAAGCDDFVAKPYSPRELLRKIRQHLR